MDEYYDLSDENLKRILYDNATISTPFVPKITLTYADFTASGLPSPFIEKYLQTKVYPFYSNTHSNANNGLLMRQLIEEAKQYIHQQMNINDEYKIIFTGSGCTGAINHLANAIDCTRYTHIYIFISLYEHYSNFLPWAEMSKSCKYIQLNYIPFEKTSKNNGFIDLDWLNKKINDIHTKSNSGKTLVICSISACSNINGIINPMTKIYNLLAKFNNTTHFTKLFFADFACCAPYIKIDGSLFDAFFFSPHKFIGGIGTPGVLIAKKQIFEKEKPFCPGGGCVIDASTKYIVYNNDIETRETAGTPNIIGIIKIGKILQLKQYFDEIIENNEKVLCVYIKSKIKEFKKKYSTFKSVLYDDDVQHLPILSFHLTNLHYNMIVVLLNDLFGIQSRGGIGCCGLLAEYMDKEYNYRGWCRVTFHWSMRRNTIVNIMNAIEYIIQHGEHYKQYYEYDKDHNMFYYKIKN